MEITCLECGKLNPVSCTDKEYNTWLTERILPKIPLTEMELIISSICGPCFEEMFNMRFAAQVALHKLDHPEKYCPVKNCLWRTNGERCPRHEVKKETKIETKIENNQ